MTPTMQSLTDVQPQLDTLLKNPSRSLSGVFKSLRRLSKIDLVGDYPLLSFIISKAKNRPKPYLWRKSQILRAVKLCDFYKDEKRVPKEFYKMASDYEGGES